MKDVMEIFKCFEDSEYRVSNLGNITGKFKMPLTPSINKDGYYYVTLMLDTKKVFLVHQLVASVFIPNPDNKSTVNHIDCNKLNNSVLNLEWSTIPENIEHALYNGLMCRGERHGMAKLTEDDVITIIETFSTGQSNAEIAIKFGVSHATIFDIRENRTWQHVEGIRYPVLKKLFAKDIPIIREYYRDGMKNHEIARKFNVNPGTISAILSGKTWKNY